MTDDARDRNPPRDEATPPVESAGESPVRRQANSLLNAAMTYAREMLKKEGEFAPFAVTLDAFDRLEIESGTPARPAEAAEQDAARQLEALRARLAENAGQLQALALAVNVEARRAVEGGFQDAVRVEIEHQDGYCVVVLVPYRLSGGRLGGLIPRKVAFAKSMSQPGTPWAWKSSRDHTAN